MQTINKKDLKGRPIENGWYLCKYIDSGRTHYVDEDCEIEDYQIIHHTPQVLYWEDNLWLKSPYSYVCVEKRNILDWMPIPDDFSRGTVRVNTR